MKEDSDNLPLSFAGKNRNLMEGIMVVTEFHHQEGIQKYLTGIELKNNGWRPRGLDKVIGE